jgi:hypothetical protein
MAPPSTAAKADVSDRLRTATEGFSSALSIAADLLVPGAGIGSPCGFRRKSEIPSALGMIYP